MKHAHCLFFCVGAIGRYDGIGGKIVKSQSHNDVEGTCDTCYKPYVSSPSPSLLSSSSPSYISPKRPYTDNSSGLVEEEGEEAEEPRPSGQMVTTTVTIKALLKFLTSYVISGEAIMCICEGYCVIAYVYIGKFCPRLSSFLPSATEHR